MRKKIKLSEKARTVLRMLLAIFSPTLMTICLYFAASFTEKFLTRIHQLTHSTTASVSMYALISDHPILTAVLVYAATIPFVYARCVRRMRRDEEKESRITRYLMLLPFGAAVAYLANVAVGLIATYLIQSESFVGESIYSGNIAQDLIVIALLPALMEEIIYRGAVYNGLKYFMNKWLAIIVSAIIFALMHQSPAQAIYAFILGLIFAGIYEHYGNLLASILLHFGANALSVIGSDWEPVKEFFSTERGAIYTLVGSAGVFLLIVLIIALDSRKRARVSKQQIGCESRVVRLQ